MSEETPSATDLRQEHIRHAADVEFLGKLATSEGDTKYYVDDENVHFRHQLVPGYTTAKDNGEYSFSAPAGAQAHLEKAHQAAQTALDKSDTRAAKVVRNDLDRFKSEAQIDMARDVTNQHRDNLAEVEGYAQTSDRYPELHEGAISRAQDYEQRHSDILTGPPS